MTDRRISDLADKVAERWNLCDKSRKLKVIAFEAIVEEVGKKETAMRLLGPVMEELGLRGRQARSRSAKRRKAVAEQNGPSQAPSREFQGEFDFPFPM